MGVGKGWGALFPFPVSIYICILQCLYNADLMESRMKLYPYLWYITVECVSFGHPFTFMTDTDVILQFNPNFLLVYM